MPGPFFIRRQRADPPPVASEDPRRRLESLPSFALTDIGGTQRQIRDWLGQPLIVNFWATWCPPCLREIPLLNDYQAASAHPVQVIGIAVDRDEAVQQFAAENPFNYPVLVGQSDAMDAAAQFGIDFLALPFTVFVAPDGALLAVHTGEITQGDLDNFTAVLTDLAAGSASLDTARARLSGAL